jgi:hypothetical protein
MMLHRQVPVRASGPFRGLRLRRRCARGALTHHGGLDKVPDLTED